MLDELKVQMGTDSVLRKYLNDSTISVETNNQGVLTVVIDFAPGVSREGPSADKLKAFVTKYRIIDSKEHRAGGKHHMVYETNVKARGLELKSETIFIRITHFGGTASKTERIEDADLGGGPDA